MDNRVKLTKQPDGIWTTKLEGVDRIVTVDESPVIVWRTMGLSEKGATEVTQTSNGELISITLLQTGEELNEVVFTKQHSLYLAMNIKQPYVGAA